MLKDTFGGRQADHRHDPSLRRCPARRCYDAAGGMAKVIDDAARDIEALQDGGVDAVMFGNENDRPYLLEATPVSLAAFAFAVGQLKPMIRVPFGVNYLWDPVATVSLAIASAAGFAREIFTGVYESDMGLWVPDAATALRLRADGGRPDLKLLFNINAEFASPLGNRSIGQRARNAVFSSLADVVLVSGPMTGEAVEVGRLREAKAAVPGTPVFANTGVTIDNVAEILAIGDGAVVGTHFKVERQHLEPGRPRPRRALHGQGAKFALTMALLLGLDIGTTSTIGIVIDSEGATLGGGEPAGDALHAGVELGGRGSRGVVGECRRDQPRAGLDLRVSAGGDRRHRRDRHAAGDRAPRR